tara:strand:+ start:63 stop:1034 length:972 start_codon:yes stop_codon:yes gene_type:complete
MIESKSTKELADIRVAKYFESGKFYTKDGDEIIIDVPAKVMTMWSEGIRQRSMAKKLNMAQHTVAAIRRKLDIEGRNPNIPTKSKYGISHKENPSEYARRSYAARFKEKNGYDIDAPRRGMRHAYYDEDMGLYACSCKYCNNEMLWPKSMFSLPGPVHYNNPVKYSGVLNRGCSHKTVTCTSYERWEVENKYIEWYLYIRKFRDMAKADNIPISKFKHSRREQNMKTDPMWPQFLKLFKDLDRDENGIYICPVYKKPMIREFGVVQTPTSPSLDRIDSSKPHTLDNVQIISWAANNHKGDGTLEEMVLQGEHAKRLLEKQGKL